MGFFGDIWDEATSPKREQNMVRAGVRQSNSSYEKCENCSYRAEGGSSRYYGCGRHDIDVYASTVCAYFRGGDSQYRRS